MWWLPYQWDQRGSRSLTALTTGWLQLLCKWYDSFCRCVAFPHVFPRNKNCTSMGQNWGISSWIFMSLSQAWGLCYLSCGSGEAWDPANKERSLCSHVDEHSVAVMFERHPVKRIVELFFWHCQCKNQFAFCSLFAWQVEWSFQQS